MAFAYLLPIRLASTNTGLTLNAILEDETGASINFADATSEKLTGFDEKGGGEYTFYTDQFPDASFPFTCIIRNDADDSFLASASFNEADVFSDVTKISGDSAAADALEAWADGTGAVMTLTGLDVNGQVTVDANVADGAFKITNAHATGQGFKVTGGNAAIYAEALSAGGYGIIAFDLVGSGINAYGSNYGMLLQGGAGGAGLGAVGIGAGSALRLTNLSGKSIDVTSGEIDLNGAIDADTIAQIQAGLATAADIAALAGSSLTIVTAVNGNKITVYESDTWSFTISGLGDISGYEVIAFGVKATPSVTDATATLLVRSDDGLVAIGGDAPVSASNGTVTPGSGSIAVKVAMSETPIVTAGNYLWWIKGYDTTPSPSEGYTLATGSFCVAGSGVDSITP